MAVASGGVVGDIAAAHGAAGLAGAAYVRVRFSSGGLAFAAKGQRSALRDAVADLDPREQRVTVRGVHPRPWRVCVAGTVELRPRLAALHRGARLLRWTPEDVGVFAAAALWTYVTMPLLVSRGEARALGTGGAGRPPRARARRVRVDLADRVAGHGPVHVLHVDPGGLIVRHDYTATAFGRWARAAQTVGEYRAVDGVLVGTRRRVTPRLGRWRLPGPTLVWIEIHEVTVGRDPAAPATT